MAFTVTDVPHLPAGFTDAFTSRRVDAGGITLHAVTRGDGPPLLLLPAWPRFRYGWRLVMPARAERFAVAGDDLGMLAGYALAASHRERVTRPPSTQVRGWTDDGPLTIPVLAIGAEADMRLVTGDVTGLVVPDAATKALLAFFA
jgi:hypothetical protein